MVSALAVRQKHCEVGLAVEVARLGNEAGLEVVDQELGEDLLAAAEVDHMLFVVERMDLVAAASCTDSERLVVVEAYLLDQAKADFLELVRIDLRVRLLMWMEAVDMVRRLGGWEAEQARLVVSNRLGIVVVGYRRSQNLMTVVALFALEAL